MTFEDKVEVRRQSVGTKVLVFGFAILAVLGSFWTVVWFIRSYVEPPRVNIAPSMALAARESTPVVPPAPTAKPAPIGAAQQKPADLPPPVITAEAAPSAPPAAQPDPQSPSGAIADRWMPMTPAAAPAPEPAPALAPETTQAIAPATEAADPTPEEVAETSVPAISGRAPLPRRKPMQTAAVRSRTDPPLPRPRPDGPAPQSVWTAVPTTDDRFPQQ
jgi:hypothetical protein